MKEQSPTHKPSLTDRWRLRRVQRQIANALDYFFILADKEQNPKHGSEMRGLLTHELRTVERALTDLEDRRSALTRYWPRITPLYRRSG